MRGSRPALLLAAAALLVLVVLVARGESAVPGRLRDVSIEPGLPHPTVTNPVVDTPPPPAAGLQYSSNDPVLFAEVVIGLLGLVLLLALVLSILSWLRGRDRASSATDRPDQLEGTIDTVMRLRLRDAVTKARDVLARPGGEPRDAVIRAWATLEQATDGRPPHQTATEFTVSLLAKETTDEDALRELRTLYHRARFGHHSTESDARQARTALDRILATIR